MQKVLIFCSIYFSFAEYKKAIKIPKGARKVEIVEMEPSINMIAVQNADEEFVLNGNPDKEASDGEKNLSANLALYEHTEPKKEYLYLPGPTDQDLTIFIYFNDDDNVGYQYSYYVYVKIKKSGMSDDDIEDFDVDHPEYHWENVDWSECNARCDGGEAKSESKCISNSGGGEVNDQFCLKLVPKPESMTRVCNKDECKIFWHTGDWAPCSGCKHHPGAQFRSVWCAKLSPRFDEADILTSEKDCLDADGPKPSTKQLCVDECKKVNCRRSRSPNSEQHIDFDEKDIYNYKFFEKLFQKINKDMKEPNEKIVKLGSIDEVPQPPIVIESTAKVPTFIPSTAIPTATVAPPNSDADTESQMNIVQNPDITKPKTMESEKCPTRSVLDSLGAHRMGHKRMMFLFPRRRVFRRKRKLARAAESKTQTPPLLIVKDKVPESAVVIEEAKIKMPNTDWLSDYAYQRLGDRVTGSIDLDHEKVWIGEKAIVKIEKERKNSGL